MAPSDDDQLELQQAADALGVHYQTAYRWVRTGRLPASLVRGRYCVSRRDLATVGAELRAPMARRPPGVRRLDAQQQRMYDALVGGDEPRARHIANQLVAEGTTIIALLQRVLVPALRRIGDGWHREDLPIWAEHRASAIVERILGDLVPNPRGRRRGVVAVTSITGDHHALPTTMATVALRDANWHVHHLGADTPPTEVVQFCTDQQVDLAVLTVTNTECAPLAEHTALTLRDAGVPTLVGGPGRTLDELLDEAARAVTARHATS